MMLLSAMGLGLKPFLGCNPSKFSVKREWKASLDQVLDVLGDVEMVGSMPYISGGKYIF